MIPKLAASFVVVPSSLGRWRVRQIAAPAGAIDPAARLFVNAGE